MHKAAMRQLVEDIGRLDACHGAAHAFAASQNMRNFSYGCHGGGVLNISCSGVSSWACWVAVSTAMQRALRLHGWRWVLQRRRSSAMTLGVRVCGRSMAWKQATSHTGLMGGRVAVRAHLHQMWSSHQICNLGAGHALSCEHVRLVSL